MHAERNQSIEKLIKHSFIDLSICKELQRVLSRYTNAKQTAIAQDLGLSQAAVSKALNLDTTSQKHLPTIMAWLVKTHNRFMANIDTSGETPPSDKDVRHMKSLVATISAYPPCKAEMHRNTIAAPGAVVSSFNINHIMRHADEYIDHLLTQPPFRIAVAGGPKMGKSSCANRAAELSFNTHEVVAIDCRRFPPPEPDAPDMPDEIVVTYMWREIVRSPLFQESRGLGQLYRPGELYRFLLEIVLPKIAHKDLLLIVENIHLLGPYMDSLLAMLHKSYLMQQSHFALRRLSCIVTLDPLMLETQTVSPVGHPGFTPFNWVFLEPYSRDYVERLACILHPDTSPRSCREAGEDSWREWRGHPYLTHLQLHNQSPSASGAHDEDLKSIYCNSILRPTLDHIPRSNARWLLDRIYALTMDGSDDLYNQILNSTGLFGVKSMEAWGALPYHPLCSETSPNFISELQRRADGL